MLCPTSRNASPAAVSETIPSSAAELDARVTHEFERFKVIVAEGEHPAGLIPSTPLVIAREGGRPSNHEAMYEARPRVNGSLGGYWMPAFAGMTNERA